MAVPAVIPTYKVIIIEILSPRFAGLQNDIDYQLPAVTLERSDRVQSRNDRRDVYPDSPFNFSLLKSKIFGTIKIL